MWIGTFNAVENCLSGALYLGSGAQIEHYTLNFRLVRNIGGAQLQGHRIANLLGNMHGFGAVFGNPGRQRRQVIGL
ncbi:hypothetical protein D3C87_1961380 [compost metagenome]